MSDSARPFSLGYRPALDGLRGLAVLLVLIHHLHLPFVTGGFVGVDIFFVLSGFLITSLLCEEWERFGSISFRHFYQRRALRLLPALGLLMAAIMVLASLSGSRSRFEQLGRCCLATLFYAMNWLTALQLIPWSPLSHTWSLSSEEQFYVAWPLVLRGLLAVKPGRRTILGAVAAIIVILTLYRGWLWHLGYSATRIYYSLDTHADGLITGCFVALLFSQRVVSEASRLGPWGWPALAAILLVAARGATDSSAMWYLGLPAVNLASGLVIGALVCSPDGTLAKVFRWEPMVWLGRRSYGIYLWHYPIFLQVQKSLGSKGRPLAIAVSLAATGALAAASYHFLERPLLKLKKHRPAPPGAAAPPSLSPWGPGSGIPSETSPR